MLVSNTLSNLLSKLINTITILMFHYSVIDETLKIFCVTHRFTNQKKKKLFKYKLHEQLFNKRFIQLQHYEISLLTKLPSSVHTCNNSSNQKRPVHTQSIIHVTYEPQTNLAVRQTQRRSTFTLLSEGFSKKILSELSTISLRSTDL